MNFDWLNDLLNSQLLMTISIMVFTLIILVIINRIFNKHRKLKIVFLGIILILGVLTSYLLYEKRTDIYSVMYKNYVLGEIRGISSGVKKIEVCADQTNIKGIYNGDLVVLSMIQNCKIYDSNNKEVKFEELEYGDVVKIYCKEKEYDKSNNSKITGVRMVVKQIN